MGTFMEQLRKVAPTTGERFSALLQKALWPPFSYGCNGGRAGVYCLQRSEQSGRGRTCPLTALPRQHLACRGGTDVWTSRSATGTDLSGNFAGRRTLRQSRSAILRALQPVVLPHALPRPRVASLRARAGPRLKIPTGRAAPRLSRGLRSPRAKVGKLNKQAASRFLTQAKAFVSVKNAERFASAREPRDSKRAPRVSRARIAQLR